MFSYKHGEVKTPSFKNKFLKMDKSKPPVQSPAGQVDPLELAKEPEVLEEFEFGSEALEMENTYARDAIAALTRATYASDSPEVRSASLASLVDIVESDKTSNDEKRTHRNSLLVLQTWLDRFSRMNCGTSTTEYASESRTRLLNSLETILQRIYVSDTSQSFHAALGRVITMAVEEMTRHFDLVPEIQDPCSLILVRIGRGDPDNKLSQINRVMEVLLQKFQPGLPTHFYVLKTLSDLATSNSLGVVPYLNGLLSTMLANIKGIKADNLRFAYAKAFSRFSEAISDYLSNLADAPDKTVTESHFSKEIDSAHEYLFSYWLTKGGGNSNSVNPEFNVRHAVIEALGQMAPLLSDDRVYKETTQVVNVLITLYKRTGVVDPFYITQGMACLLTEMQNRDAQIIDPILETVLTALFLQVSQYSIVSTTTSQDEKRRNHFEVLRCYDVLVKSHHKEKLLNGLLLRLTSMDDNIRLASLTIFKHLITSSLDQLQSRMKDIFEALHNKLSETSTNRTKSMLAQLTALLGRLGYLEGEMGRDFLEFIVKLCALPANADGDDNSGVYNSAANIISTFLSDYETINVSNSHLREMCDNILRLLASNVPSMEVVLWPQLIDYLLAPDYSGGVPSIVKCLSQLAQKKRESSSPDFVIDYSNLVNVSGPQVVFARLIVLASVPFLDGRGSHILTFMQHFAPNINKHLTPLWDQRIPLLLHYLETHSNLSEGATNAFDQAQWEEWLLALLKDTLDEVDLDEWTSGVATTLSSHLSFYQLIPEDNCSTIEKLFLIRCLGRVLRSAKHGHHGQLILINLSSLFLATCHKEDRQRSACAEAYGYCAARHLNIVLEKLENLLVGTDQRRRRGGTLFGLLRDGSKSEEELRLATRSTILRCVGESAMYAEAKDLLSKANEMTQKFIMPALQSSEVGLKLTALQSAADIARALQKIQQKPGSTFTLVHHGDLIHEAIECMKSNKWMIKEKEVAVATALELVRLPPYVSQLTRCSLLKACFTAVFPCLIRSSDSHLGDPKQKKILDKLLKIVQALLLQELKQSTLDEIFTLIEPYLKQPEAISREMAVIILQTSLQTFLSNYNFKDGPDSEVPRDGFSPTPYIIGGIVPRCFDVSKQVQSKALGCLHVILKISLQAEKEAGKIISSDSEDQLRALQGVAASCSPLNASSHDSETGGISTSSIATAVSDVLHRLVSSQHLHPLVTSLIDSLEDDVGGRGTALVLASVLESRGSESTLMSRTRSFLTLLHSKLLVFDSKELKSQILTSVRTLAVHNHPQVVESLLDDHSLPYDAAVVRIWQAFAQDCNLAADIMRKILEILNPLSVGVELEEKQIFYEERDRISEKNFRVAKRPYLSAVIALGILFSESEMEKVLEGEFPQVFVPLLFALACYTGVSTSEPKPKPKLLSESTSVASSIVPYTSTANTMKSFLAFFRGLDFPEGIDLSPDQYDCRNSLQFTEVVFALSENILLDFPSFTPKISSMLFQLLSFRQNENGEPALLSYHRIAALAFFTQICKTDAPVEVSLIDTAMEVLLNFHQDPESNVRILCLQGLARFQIDSIPYCARLTKHAPGILRAFMTLTGDNFDCDVNYHSLTGLSKVLTALPDEVVAANLSEVVGKVQPFIDNSRKDKDSAAAIYCIGSLADFVLTCQMADFKEIFLELVNTGVLVSLLLHINDVCDEKREASRVATKKILNTFEDSQLKNVGQLLSSDNFDYGDFLRQFARTQSSKLRDVFPNHISKTINYFRISDSRLRANSVLYLSNLLLDGRSPQDGVDCTSVCTAMAKLLTDPSVEVQKMAAANLGKVLVQLRDLNNAQVAKNDLNKKEVN